MALLRPGRCGSRRQRGCLQHRTEAQRRPKGQDAGGTPALPGEAVPVVPWGVSGGRLLRKPTCTLWEPPVCPRAGRPPCRADHSRKNGRSIMKTNHEWTRIDQKTDRPPSTTSGAKIHLQFCALGVTMSWDEGFPGARASRPHKAWRSLGHLPHLDQPGTASWLSPPQGAQQRPSWKSFPPARPLIGPSRASSNPLVALRRSSWPFVDNSFPFVLFVDPLRGFLFESFPTPWSPFAVLRGPWWISFSP